MCKCYNEKHSNRHHRSQNIPACLYSIARLPACLQEHNLRPYFDRRAGGVNKRTYLSPRKPFEATLHLHFQRALLTAKNVRKLVRSARILDVLLRRSQQKKRLALEKGRRYGKRIRGIGTKAFHVLPGAVESTTSTTPAASSAAAVFAWST